MERFFNTAGPVDCDIHYCLPPLSRLDLDEVLRLIDQRKYFVLHAPRQTGKTSCLLSLMHHLNRKGRYRALYVNVEVGQSAREQIEPAMRAIMGQIAGQASRILKDDRFYIDFPDILARHGGHGALNELLTQWTGGDPRPAVLMLDEVDALIGDTLISFLRQLRAGYDRRGTSFPQSIIICGVRDVRDYRIHSSSEKTVITGGSAFNVKTQSLRLGDFSEAEVLDLLNIHTRETGQTFSPAASTAVWHLSAGQPWLVNALADETCFSKAGARDRGIAISEEMVNQARERLILRRDTHLDQLSDKLSEPRVRRVIAPMLRGETMEGTVSDDDISYCTDLGLIRRGADGPQISNPIYREIIPRQISHITQLNLEGLIRREWYMRSDGRLDMEKLMEAFQDFFREHSEHWVERFDYREAGPQLLMQAFLQRVINSGGRIERKYGQGRGRTDLFVIWPHPGGVQKIVIELKLLHKSREKTIAEGLEQTIAYMDRCGAGTGHLVIFDRAEAKPWEEKIFQRSDRRHGRTVEIWGM